MVLDMTLYPLKFKPILKTLVWGGEKLVPYKGLETSRDHVGESWEISGVKGSESIVDGGSFDGRTITSLISEFKGLLVGESVYARTGDEFPLLIKFIDAADDLSIQVHPDDALAAQRHSTNGKTEMWYAIGADPGAHLYAGLKAGLTPEEYERRISDDSITDVLARHEVSPGDVFFLPAGRIHAICGGCFLAEIQQTSDITYRIYDYNRPGLDGKPRELHTALAKDAIDYKVYPDYRTHYVPVPDGRSELISCKYFTTSLYDLSKPLSVDLSSLDSFLAVICVEGRGTILDSEPVFTQGPDGAMVPGPTKGHVTEIRQGETVLVPASSKGISFRPEGRMKVLTSCVSKEA